MILQSQLSRPEISRWWSLQLARHSQVLLLPVQRYEYSEIALVGAWETFGNTQFGGFCLLCYSGTI